MSHGPGLREKHIMLYWHQENDFFLHSAREIMETTTEPNFEQIISSSSPENNRWGFDNSGRYTDSNR